MKTICKNLILSAFFAVLVMHIAVADPPDASIGIGISITPSDFSPLIWMDPNTRVVLRDPGTGSTELIERTNNYAFEGEQIEWEVLVMDKNGVETIDDVHVTVGPVQGIGNPIEAACDLNTTTNNATTVPLKS